MKKVRLVGEGVSAEQVFRAKKLTGDIKVEVDGHVVPLTHLDKVYWPDDGYTKGDLVRYYFNVAEYVLPYLRDRPLILKRFPNGIDQKFFFQHDVDEVPDFVHTFTTEAEGHTVDYVVCDNTATLLYLANLGTIPMHPWHSRVGDIDHADWIVFDLDPGKVEFEAVRQLSLKARDVLDRLGLTGYPKTSGSRGMHLYVPIEPIYTYEEVASFAERVANVIVRENREIATLTRSLGVRKRGSIYVDHLQNARGKTVVAPYSVRERPGATVSAPLDWEEVERGVTPQDFTIKNMLPRLKKKGDVFEGVLNRKQRLEEAITILDSLEKATVRRKGTRP